MSRSVAAVAVVDARGWLLLQERDESAPTDPDRWSLVGGSIEPGETQGGAAARELEEETGLTGIELTALGVYEYYCDGCGEVHQAALFTALTELTDADVECHEGRRIIFVDPSTIHTLPWTRGLAVALPRVIGHPSYSARFGADRRSHEFGAVLLVNADGDVLLQERDELAPIDPDRWGLPGGHLEAGEEPEAGAYREVEEETGVRLEPGTLEPFASPAVFHPSYGTVDRAHVFAARVDLTDADIECHEGRRIVFVAPDRARDLDLTMTGVLVVPPFLDSDTYRRLCS